MNLSFDVACEPGLRRTNNEDAFCVRPDIGLFAVADGLGGYDAGEVASRTALDAIEQVIAETVGFTEQSRWPLGYQPALGVDGNRLNWAFQIADDRVRIEAERVGGRQGMATTLAVLLLDGDDGRVRVPARTGTIGHVGDSRIYLFRSGHLARLTEDHSWIQEQVRAGAVSEDEARRHPRRNILTRAVRGMAGPLGEFGSVPFHSGDRLLLCTDGLHGVVSDDDMAQIIASQDVSDASDRTVRLQVGSEDTLPSVAVAKTVCDALVQAANAAGGPDNITAVFIRV